MTRLDTLSQSGLRNRFVELQIELFANGANIFDELRNRRNNSTGWTQSERLASAVKIASLKEYRKDIIRNRKLVQNRLADFD